MSDCNRCARPLDLGLVVIRIYGVNSEVQRELCGACNEALRDWFATYQPSYAGDASNITSINRKGLGK